MGDSRNEETDRVHEYLVKVVPSFQYLPTLFKDIVFGNYSILHTLNTKQPVSSPFYDSNSNIDKDILEPLVVFFTNLWDQIQRDTSHQIYKQMETIAAARAALSSDNCPPLIIPQFTFDSIVTASFRALPEAGENVGQTTAQCLNGITQKHLDVKHPTTATPDLTVVATSSVAGPSSSSSSSTGQISYFDEIMLTYKTIDALIDEQITVSDDIIDKIQKISAVDVAESNLTMTIPKCTELSITCTSKTPLFNLDPKELLTHYTRTFLVPSMRNAVCIVLKEYLYDKEETGRFEFSVLVYAFTKGYLNNFMLHLVNDGAFDVILHYTNNKALPLDFKSVLGDGVTEKWFVNDATNFLFCKATGKYKPTLPENRSERNIKQHCSLVTRISKQLGYNSLKHAGRFKGGYGPLSFIVSESGPNYIKNIVNSSSYDDDKLYEVESASERCLIGAPVDTGSIYRHLGITKL